MLNRMSCPTLALALLILSISIAIVCLAHNSIIKRENHYLTLSPNLHQGTSHLELHHIDGCAGLIDAKLERGENHLLELTATGELLVKIQDINIPLQFTLEASFNSLKQLGGTILRMDVGGQEILLSTLGIDPITIQVAINRPGPSFRKQITIPGPILLHSVDTHSYQLRYTSANFTHDQVPVAAFQALSTLLPITVVGIDIPSDACLTTGRTALNLAEQGHFISSLATMVETDYSKGSN